MKPSVILCTASLAANAVLLGVFALRPAGAARISDEEIQRGPTAGKSAGASDAVHQNLDEKVRAENISRETGALSAQLWAALDSTELPTLIARLRAAGFPARTIRRIVGDRIDDLLAARMKEIVGTQSDKPYWQTGQAGASYSPKYYEAMNQLYRDRAAMLREALSDDFFANAPLGAAELEQRRQLGSLPKNKADFVQRIADDYAAMASQIRAATGGIILPEDKEQLALLEREKRADLSATLTPQEIEEYEMRTSTVTSRLRSALTLMDATEEEFRAIYAAQQPHSDALYPASNAFNAERHKEARRIVAEQLKAALGEQRYVDFARSTNHEFQQLNQIAQRENVSREAAVRAFDLRDGVARESNRIFDDAALSVEQKRAALQVLAQNTKAQLRTTLGPPASDAYVKTAHWLSRVESGGAVTFGPDGLPARSRNLPPSAKKTP